MDTNSNINFPPGKSEKNVSRKLRASARSLNKNEKNEIFLTNMVWTAFNMGGEVSRSAFCGQKFKHFVEECKMPINEEHLKKWGETTVPVRLYPASETKDNAEKMPWLYTSGVPVIKDQIQCLVEALNIGLIVSLNASPLTYFRSFNLSLGSNPANPEYTDRDLDMLDIPSLPTLLHVPINDADYPNEEKISRVINAVKEARNRDKHVLLHCWAGKGRSLWMAHRVYCELERIPPEKLELVLYSRRMSNFQRRNLIPPRGEREREREMLVLPLSVNPKISREMVFLETVMQGVNLLESSMLSSNFIDYKKIGHKYFSCEDDGGEYPIAGEFLNFDWGKIKGEIRLNSCGGDAEIAKELEKFVLENCYYCQRPLKYILEAYSNLLEA